MLLRRLALASLAANVAIVITGGAVRLTGSGLGCPTWPMCTDSSYTTTPEMGVHGAIEFGNRMLGGVVGLIAIAVLVAAVRSRRDLVGLAALALAGVAAQGLLGGATVRTGLNPWIVATHFLLSMALIAVGYALWRRTTRPARGAGAQAGEAGAAGRFVVGRPVLGLVGLVTGMAAVVLVLGTVVTGSGPHAGDPDTARMGFDLRTVAQLHADAVFVLVGLTVALWFTLRAVDAPPPAVRAVAVLIGVELAQGAVGFVQYLTHLPVLAVGLHLAGACAVWLATLAMWPSVRMTASARGDASDAPSQSCDMTDATPRGMMAACPPPSPAPGPAARTYANS